MKLLKKLSQDYSLILFLTFFPLVIFTFSFVIHVKDGSLFFLSSRIPIAISKNVLGTVGMYLLSILTSVTTYFALIVFPSVKEKRELLIFGFTGYLFVVIYLASFIAIGGIPFFKPLLFLFLNIFIIFGFLVLFEKLFKSSVLSSVLLLLVQLIGGGFVYLYEFSEMFSSGLQLAVKGVYGALPFYQKILSVYQDGNYKSIVFVFFVSFSVCILVIYRNRIKNN